MKLSRVQRPTPKPQRASGSAGAREHFGRWALDSGSGTRKNLGTWNLELGASPPDQPSAFSLQPSAFGPQGGVALVVTLIMLSIITFLAVAFLVLTQRENQSSTTALDQKTALMAADSALNRVCAEILADGMVTSNFEVFGMKVSTNYINYNGFNPGLNPAQNPTNINFDHLINAGGALNPAEWVANIASLEFNPRAPVFVVTNQSTGAMDFRFQVDLNRNGKFETNGLWPFLAPLAGAPPNNVGYVTTNASGQYVTVPLTSQPAWILSNNFVGDPEWIGVLERPQEMHAADNRFVSRYAYLVVPAGSTLDINYMHNRAKHLLPAQEGFYRNQGVGTYEDNLAGFLADLNTNMWWDTPSGVSGYFYNQSQTASSTGSAFVNANDLLSFRYGPPGYNSLNTPGQLFPNNAAAWNSANVDLYASGPLMLGADPNPPLPLFNANTNWAGADNTNHVWTIQDYFNSSLMPGSTFPGNLQALGTSNDSYNAYTYYNLISQLGSDSAPETNKININWKNTDTNGNIIPGMETNQLAWTPLDFFTNAADRMFRQLQMHDLEGKLITVTNIPFYEDSSNPTYRFTNINYYTPAVHRVLQLAANIYDATSSRFVRRGPTNYPSVFRPVFMNRNGIGSIVGYMEVTNTSTDPSPFNLFLDASNFVAITPQNIMNQFVNVYGVPWVIGAKKGFPNFNEMSMLNEIGVQRELAFTNKASLGHWQTNQLFNFYFTNRLGIEGWNSYSNQYGRPLKLYVTNLISLSITDQVTGKTLLSVVDYPYSNVTNLPTGWVGGAAPKIQFFTNSLFTNGSYILGKILPLNPVSWDATILPRIFMKFDFKLQYVLIDTLANRVIDFVNLTGPQPQLLSAINDPMDVTSMLAVNANEAHVDLSGGANHGNDIFATNTVGGQPGGIIDGVINQINAELGMINLTGTPKDPSLLNKLNGQIAFDEPSAIGTIEQSISWQANDPLVHYTAQDLTSMEGKLVTYNRAYMVPPGSLTPTLSQSMPNLGQTNFTYRPWPNNPNNVDTTSGSDGNFRMKDSLMANSDAWDFPTNTFWNVGILGRVHRGTPWQSIYMKPTNGLSLNNWSQWANDNVLLTNYTANGIIVTPDAANTFPSQDYLLFDLFTSTPNGNSSRGQLNINQPGLASWAAIFTGVNVISNGLNGIPVPYTIDPAGVFTNTPNNPGLATPLARIWMGITAARTNNNITNGIVFPNNAFQHLGDILSVPQLTVASPYINTNSGTPTDEEMERIPQQVMSLLTLNQNPRFVIYSFGQTLHPADHSQVAGGTFNGLCTNYQITAEIATRAVIRVEGSPDPQYTNDFAHVPPNPHPDPQGRFYPPRIVVEQFNVLGPDQ